MNKSYLICGYEIMEIYHQFLPEEPFCYSKNESKWNDIVTQLFVDFSNVHNSDGSSNATQSNLP